MNSAQLDKNAECIEAEIAWFNSILDRRIKLHFEDVQAPNDLLALLPPPALPQADVPYARVVRQFNLQPAERLVLMLGLIPHLKPHLLDIFFSRPESRDRGYTEFGGINGNSHGGFLPTCETAMFLLAGDNLAARLRYDDIFESDGILFARGILHLDRQHANEPPLAAALRLSPEYRALSIKGKTYIPPFSAEFPAQQIATDLNWEDLILEPSTRQRIDDILTWLQHKVVLMDEWNLKKHIKPGFRSIFYGPPGTGKTMTACLLGKKTGLPVFRIDLSKILSKYIGETEKNLANLFDRAQDRDWILFFDEAESLFGKRVESQNSNDRAANQQVSYLLQRIEDYTGLAILATNLRTHLDEAFARRFQSMIRFPIPNAAQRLQLWQDSFGDKPFDLAEDVDFDKLANEYELAGGDIINILRYACLKAIERQPPTIYADDLLEAIEREFQKQSRPPQKANGRFVTTSPSSRRFDKGI